MSGQVAFVGSLGTVLALGSLALLSSCYTVEEGHVGVLTRFGEATEQTPPGLHFKTPFVEGVQEIEVRERRTALELAASTRDELPITVQFSMNWALDPSEVLETYRDYGGLEQFETRVLNPLIAQAAKASLARFSASELITKRTEAATMAFEEIQRGAARLPITVNSPNIENVELPGGYMAAVLRKEEARQEREAEQQRLEQQRLVAQRTVQTAQAEAEAAVAAAEAEATAIRTRAAAEAEANLALAESEAKALEMRADALSRNPRLIEYEQAKRWDGVLPRMTFGATAAPQFLMPLDGAQP